MITSITGYGQREIGEECGGSRLRDDTLFNEDRRQFGEDRRQFYPPVPENQRCKTEKGLYCNEYSRRCKCHELSGSIYNDDLDRCELAIDHFCTTREVKPSIDGLGIDYQHFCPLDADCTCNYHMEKRFWKRCENENGLCKCQFGYSPYDDGRACWYSKGGQVTGVKFIIFVSSLLTVWFN